MSNTITQLLAQVRNQPETISFQTAMDIINAHFDYTPTRFTNGRGDDKVVNEAGTNEGSCRLFAFGLLQALTPAETLALFGQYYRDDVLKNPEGSDHANIRSFMRHGWSGIHFDGVALKPKSR